MRVSKPSWCSSPNQSPVILKNSLLGSASEPLRGLMALLNDPVPCPDSCIQAVRMAADAPPPRQSPQARASARAINRHHRVPSTIANVSGTGGVKSRPTRFGFCTKKYALCGNCLNLEFGLIHLCVKFPSHGGHGIDVYPNTRRSCIT